MCEDCIYSEYDTIIEQFYCSLNFIDEDDFAKINYSKPGNYSCPYYKKGNEYTIVNKQI